MYVAIPKFTAIFLSGDGLLLTTGGLEEVVFCKLTVGFVPAGATGLWDGVFLLCACIGLEAVSQMRFFNSHYHLLHFFCASSADKKLSTPLGE
jgi:hypothetical protein